MNPAPEPGPPEWEDAITAAEAIRAAEMAELETAYRLQLGREMYELGRQAGRGEHDAEVDAGRAAAREVPDPETIDAINKAAAAEHRAIQEARWGPGGRYHFADPRPGDFPGRQPQPAPEPEAEAG